MLDSRKPEPIDGIEALDRANWDEAVELHRNPPRRDHSVAWTETTFVVPDAERVTGQLEARLTSYRREEEARHARMMDWANNPNCTETPESTLRASGLAAFRAHWDRQGLGDFADATMADYWEYRYSGILRRIGIMQTALERLRAGNYPAVLAHAKAKCPGVTFIYWMVESAIDLAEGKTLASETRS